MRVRMTAPMTTSHLSSFVSLRQYSTVAFCFHGLQNWKDRISFYMDPLQRDTSVTHSIPKPIFNPNSSSLITSRLVDQQLNVSSPEFCSSLASHHLPKIISPSPPHSPAKIILNTVPWGCFSSSLIHDRELTPQCCVTAKDVTQVLPYLYKPHILLTCIPVLTCRISNKWWFFVWSIFASPTVKLIADPYVSVISGCISATGWLRKWTLAFPLSL